MALLRKGVADCTGAVRSSASGPTNATWKNAAAVEGKKTPPPPLESGSPTSGKAERPGRASACGPLKAIGEGRGPDWGRAVIGRIHVNGLEQTAISSAAVRPRQGARDGGAAAAVAAVDAEASASAGSTAIITKCEDGIVITTATRDGKYCRVLQLGKPTGHADRRRIKKTSRS